MKASGMMEIKSPTGEEDSCDILPSVWESSFSTGGYYCELAVIAWIKERSCRDIVGHCTVDCEQVNCSVRCTKAGTMSIAQNADMTSQVSLLSVLLCNQGSDSLVCLLMSVIVLRTRWVRLTTSWHHGSMAAWHLIIKGCWSANGTIL